MKKTLRFLLTNIYTLILMLLAIFLFWEGYGKGYVEDYIDINYGNNIKQTYNNSELIKDLLKIEDTPDDS